jgi:hypothetical protein
MRERAKKGLADALFIRLRANIGGTSSQMHSYFERTLAKTNDGRFPRFRSLFTKLSRKSAANPMQKTPPSISKN